MQEIENEINIDVKRISMLIVDGKFESETKNITNGCK